MQVPAPFEYDARHQRRRGHRTPRPARLRGPAHRRRAQPAADDEAAPGQPRVRRRHQRPARRARLRAARDRRGPDRRDDPAPGAAGVAGARSPLPDLRRRRAGDRRPGRPQPRHHRRLAVPGGPVRGPDRRVHHPRRQLRDPRAPTGERVVSMEDFFRGPYETAVEQAEILTEIRIPVRPHGSSAYAKVERRAGDWAVTSAGAAVWMDGDVITDARVGLAAVGPEHHRASRRSPTLLRGQAAVRGAVRRRPARSPRESCSPVDRQPRAPRTTSGTSPTS